MKKLLTLFAAGALLLGLASCGKSEAKKLRVGVSIPAADHGWTGGIVWSAEDAKKRLEAANPDLEIVISTARDAAEILAETKPDADVGGLRLFFDGADALAFGGTDTSKLDIKKLDAQLGTLVGKLSK